jgi:hypothetical protein
MKSIYSDPKDWGRKVVGSPLRYRLMQALTLVSGFVLTFISYLLCKELHLPVLAYLGVVLGLMVFLVELPLCYLRALRFYVLERQQRANEIS